PGRPEGGGAGGAAGVPAVSPSLAAQRGVHRGGNRPDRGLVDVSPAGPLPSPAQPPAPPGGERAGAVLARPRAAAPGDRAVGDLPPFAGGRAVPPGTRRRHGAELPLLPRDAPHPEPHDVATAERGWLRRAGGRLSLLPHTPRHRRLDRRDDGPTLVADDGAQRRRRGARLPRLGRRAPPPADAIVGAPARRCLISSLRRPGSVPTASPRRRRPCRSPGPTPSWCGCRASRCRGSRSRTRAGSGCWRR